MTARRGAAGKSWVWPGCPDSPQSAMTLANIAIRRGVCVPVRAGAVRAVGTSARTVKSRVKRS
jgi:hypothetical protein